MFLHPVVMSEARRLIAYPGNKQLRNDPLRTSQSSLGNGHRLAMTLLIEAQRLLIFATGNLPQDYQSS